MRRAKTHFEQIPVALVKKIAEEAFPEVKEIRNDNVILKVPAKKTEPHASRAHSGCRNRLSRDLRPSLCALDVIRECHFRKSPR